MALLLAAREVWAGPYGGVAIVLLPAYFIICGVIAGRAVRTALRSRSRGFAVASALSVGAATAVGAAWTFNSIGGDEPLLGRLFLWAVGAGVLWAICADPSRRRAAAATTLVAITMTLVAVVLDRPVAEVPSADRTPVSDHEVARDDGPATEPADDTLSSAVAALQAVVLPIDVEGLTAVLGDMPPRLAGRSRNPGPADGEVLYGDGADEPFFLVAMEAEDIGVRDETNSQLLEIEARRGDRKVTARETDPSAPVLYVAGTEASGSTHFLVWTSPENPFVFAAGADSAEHLALLLSAFASAVR